MSVRTIFHLPTLFNYLRGQGLQDFLTRNFFNEEVDFRSQNPSVYPLGKLHFHHAQENGFTFWLTEDEELLVMVLKSGEIRDVFEEDIFMLWDEFQ